MVDDVAADKNIIRNERRDRPWSGFRVFGYAHDHIDLGSLSGKFNMRQPLNIAKACLVSFVGSVMRHQHMIVSIKPDLLILPNTQE
jgi:hypothetical protein